MQFLVCCIVYTAYYIQWFVLIRKQGFSYPENPFCGLVLNKYGEYPFHSLPTQCVSTYTFVCTQVTILMIFLIISYFLVVADDAKHEQDHGSTKSCQNIARLWKREHQDGNEWRNEWVMSHSFISVTLVTCWCLL